MKKVLVLIALSPFLLFAGEDLKSRIQIIKTSSEIDANLTDNEAVYEFQFKINERIPGKQEVLYAIDGKNKKQTTKNGIITVPTQAGKHIFQFYFNDQYLEVYSDSLQIEANYRDKYQINLTSSTEIIVVSKPVIYFYPESSTDVKVKMDIHGEDPFLYPTYKNSWKFTAEPNGNLKFGKESYNYLFWEANTRKVLQPKQTASGFFVEGELAVQFLEEKLSLAGLNSKEQADFITFWGPRLAQNELNFVHFEFNEACEEYANIDISPKPDNFYRIFMIWGAVSEEFRVTEQNIEQFDRSGFSVLEWGGKESHIKQSFVNQNK